MPIREADAWRLQYFVDAGCPPHVEIPTEDSDAWLWNPRHRWVYDKIAIARSQGLEAAPHGVMPPRFPVFSKPIVNLRGMGMGSRVIDDADEYAHALTAGHMWMPLLEGDHVSCDVAVVDGVPRWWRHATGKPLGEGTFDHWTVRAAPDTVLEERCGAWVRTHLASYTGILNLETIGGVIIEAHLRMSDQWPDLYGAGWLKSVIRLYEHGDWSFADDDRRDGFSVVLFGPQPAAGRRYQHPPTALVEAVLGMPNVSSVQITFYEDRAARWHAMPPGGFRLAIVNCFDLDVGRAARSKLRTFFLK